jgi:hypothetical protein
LKLFKIFSVYFSLTVPYCLYSCVCTAPAWQRRNTKHSVVTKLMTLAELALADENQSQAEQQKYHSVNGKTALLVLLCARKVDAYSVDVRQWSLGCEEDIKCAETIGTSRSLSRGGPGELAGSGGCTLAGGGEGALAGGGGGALASGGGGAVAGGGRGALAGDGGDAAARRSHGRRRA